MNEQLTNFEQLYEPYLKALQELAIKYKIARKARDYETIQDIRDALAEGDIIMAPDYEAEALSYFQTIENKYKECEASREMEYRKLVGKNRGEGEKKYTYATQKEAENAAFIDCGEARLIKIAAEKNYRKIKELYRKKEHLYNTIASRLRKYEKQ